MIGMIPPDVQEPPMCAVQSSPGRTIPTADATAAATKLGYTKISELSSGQAVYKLGNDYITRDIDGHIGGAWKRASSVANLSSKTARTGTYNADLTKRIGN